MLRRIFSLLVSIPLAMLIVAIAVTNRQDVQLILDPLNPDNPAYSVELPFYGYLIIALVCGIILGGLATWLGQSRWRKTARTQGQRAARWQAEADRLARERHAALEAANHNDNALVDARTG